MGVRERPQTAVRLDDAVRSRLYRYVHRSGRTLNWIVNAAVDDYLARMEREDTTVRGSGS